MTTDFITTKMWSRNNQIGIRLFLQSHNFKDFVVFKDTRSESCKLRVAFSVRDQDWMLLKLKYHNLNDAIGDYISANRKTSYQIILNQLCEQVVSDDA